MNKWPTGQPVGRIHGGTVPIISGSILIFKYIVQRQFAHTHTYIYVCIYVYLVTIYLCIFSFNQRCYILLPHYKNDHGYNHKYPKRCIPKYSLKNVTLAVSYMPSICWAQLCPAGGLAARQTTSTTNIFILPTQNCLAQNLRDNSPIHRNATYRRFQSRHSLFGQDFPSQGPTSPWRTRRRAVICFFVIIPWCIPNETLLFCIKNWLVVQ